jgi:hypothetical protein
MYLITKSNFTCNKYSAISKYAYKVEVINGFDLPKDSLVFRKKNSKKVRIGKRKIRPSFNLLIFEPDILDKGELRRMLKRSLAIKIAPSHYIFPNIDYGSLKNKKIFSQSDFRKKWEDTRVISSLHPIYPSTQSPLEKIVQEHIEVAKDRIKKACLSPSARTIDKNGFSKKASDVRVKLKIFKTKCQVYSYFLKLDLEKEYMKAYLTFNRYKKSFDKHNNSIKPMDDVLSQVS